MDSSRKEGGLTIVSVGRMQAAREKGRLYPLGGCQKILIRKSLRTREKGGLMISILIIISYMPLSQNARVFFIDTHGNNMLSRAEKER